MERSISFEGTPPCPYLNENDRRHYQRKARLVKLWRADAWARYNAITRKEKPVGRATVLLEIGTNRPNQRRDPMNWYPTVKALIDGLTDARVWPDDSTEHVLVAEPRFRSDIERDHYRLTITWEIPDE